MSGKVLIIGDREILSTQVTIDDLTVLYKQYIETYGEVPTFKTCDAKHNMPQGRIINRVLKENNILYNDFLVQFGKTSRVRSSPEDYETYLKKYIDVSSKLGRGLTIEELRNNSYGLPQSRYFAKYCPSNTVNTFDDFVKWCGFNSNKPSKDDEEIEKN